MKDTIVFDNTNFSDLLREIHASTQKKRLTIEGMIEQLQGLIKTTDHAVVLAPMIKDYLDVLVKNDDSLVKMAAIVQRIIALESGKQGGGIEDLLSDAEKEKLMESAVKELDAEVEKLKDKHSKVVGSITP